MTKNCTTKPVDIYCQSATALSFTERTVAELHTRCCRHSPAKISQSQSRHNSSFKKCVTVEYETHVDCRHIDCMPDVGQVSAWPSTTATDQPNKYATHLIRPTFSEDLTIPAVSSTHLHYLDLQRDR